MKITQYTKKDLLTSTDSNGFWGQSNISSIQTKLLHLLDNPILDDHNPVIFTGEENEQIVSYLTVCPEYIKLNGEITKIYWLNSWWVDPVFQETGIAGLLFFKAWNTLDKKIAVASFSGSAEQFYNRIGKFDILKDKSRYSIFLNIDTNLLLLKFKFIKPLSSVFQLMRIPLSVCYSCLTYTLNYLLRKNNIEVKNTLDFTNQLWDFANKKTNNDLVIKSKEFFNWKLSNNLNFTVLHEGELVGFLSFAQVIKNPKSLNNETLRVEYFLSDSKFNKMIVFLLISLANKYKCNRIVTESEELSNLLIKYRFFWLLKITQKKNAIISKTFSIQTVPAINFNLHLGDGG